MNLKILTALVSLIISGFLSGQMALAEDTATTDKSHEAHHPKAQVAPKESAGKEMMGGGMMEGMDMDKMMGMMHTCMEQHKDGKMCNHQTMEECQKNMDKKECEKMMTQMKSKKSVKSK